MITVKQLQKRFGQAHILRGIDCEIKAREVVCVIGPSGSGKSTFLRCLNGLEEVSDGEIAIKGRDVTDLDPSERGIAMVFQSYALYPHMSVRDNLGFGLKMARTDASEIERRVRSAAAILKIDHLLDRRPGQLSGGQRQRVAIGRAIVREPDVFLFDEPLSNLDAELRVSMRIEIARLHRELGNTMIYVTHDQTEAMTLADKIVVLRDGRIEQVGSPREVYEDPANSFVAGFIGSPRMNLLPTELVRGEAAGAAATLGIRPEHVEPCDEADADLTVRVDLVEQLGGETFLYATGPNDIPLTIRCDGQSRLARGDLLPVRLRRDHLHRFDAAGLACRPEPLPARSHS